MSPKTYPELVSQALSEAIIAEPDNDVFLLATICAKVAKYKKVVGQEPADAYVNEGVCRALNKLHDMQRVQFNSEAGEVTITPKGAARFRAMGKALLPHLALREIHRTLKKTGWPGHFPILRREPSLVDLSDKQNVDAVMRSVVYLAEYSARREETINNVIVRESATQGQLTEEHEENIQLRGEVRALRAELESLRARGRKD